MTARPTNRRIWGVYREVALPRIVWNSSRNILFTTPHRQKSCSRLFVAYSTVHNIDPRCEIGYRNIAAELAHRTELYWKLYSTATAPVVLKGTSVQFCTAGEAVRGFDLLPLVPYPLHLLGLLQAHRHRRHHVRLEIRHCRHGLSGIRVAHGFLKGRNPDELSKLFFRCLGKSIPYPD